MVIMNVHNRFEAGWEYTLSSALSLRRVQVEVTSADTLNTNVTSALVDLCRLVRANWAADYYAPQVTYLPHASLLKLILRLKILL